MSDEFSDILRKIEELRAKLYASAEENDLSSEALVRISQQLDELLNEYDKFRRKQL